MNEIGDTKLTFFRDGTAITHDFTGNSGFKASLEASIKKKIGEVIAIFVHDSVVEGGANAVYRIVGIRFGRVMDVKLQENNPNRGIWIQPISYHCDGVITAPDAPTDGVAVRYGLVE